MPVKRKITEPDGVYFYGCDLVYNWFDHLKSKGRYVNGYVQQDFIDVMNEAFTR